MRDTVARFEETGSPVVTDGEQRKPSFATYPVAGLQTLAPDGVAIPFADGHERQLPLLTAGPFRYATYAASYLERARPYAHRPLKQAVISASALSLLYPPDGIDGYPQRRVPRRPRLREAEADIRRCLDAGADSVQIDFTEARLSLKLDPSGGLLRAVRRPEQPGARALHGRASGAGSASTPAPAATGTRPTAPTSTTPTCCRRCSRLDAGRFYVQLASEPDRPRVLGDRREHLRPEQLVFVGVIDPIDPRVETPEEVRDRVLEAAEYIPLDRLGTTDDCGFSPFADDISTARETAFAKIRARVLGTELAANELGVDPS